MQRRKLLVGSGVALSAIIAGCAGDETEDIDGGSRDSDDDESGTGDDGGSPDGDDGEPETGTDGDEPTGSADLEILNHELVVEPGSWSTDVYVKATVENTGEVPSGDVSLQADWYNEDGNYLGNDTGRLTSLGAGETWSARVYHLGSNSEEIADYEIEGEFGEDAYEPADGLTLVDSNMEVMGDELVVEGEVRNDSGEDQSYVEVVAKIYDSDGIVLGDEWTNVTDLREGETWAFDFDYFSQDVRNRVDEAADHEILIKDSAW